MDRRFIGRRAAARPDRAPQPRAAHCRRARSGVNEGTCARGAAAHLTPGDGVRDGRAARGSPRRESGAGEGGPRRDGGATSRTQGARSWPVPSGGGGGGAAPKIFLWQRKSTRQRKSRRRSGTAASGRDSRPGAESARGDNVATASQRATFRTPPWRQTGSALLALQEVPPASN